MNQADRNSVSALGRSMVVAFAFLLLGGFGAASAQASESIESFTSTISTTQAGGHPDIITGFSPLNRASKSRLEM